MQTLVFSRNVFECVRVTYNLFWFELTYVRLILVRRDINSTCCW